MPVLYLLYFTAQQVSSSHAREEKQLEIFGSQSGRNHTKQVKCSDLSPAAGHRADPNQPKFSTSPLIHVAY